MSKYLALAKEGLVSSMDCPLCQGLLFANMGDGDKVYTYCLSCTYKNYIGQGLYLKMLKEVEDV